MKSGILVSGRSAALGRSDLLDFSRVRDGQLLPAPLTAEREALVHATQAAVTRRRMGPLKRRRPQARIGWFLLAAALCLAPVARICCIHGHDLPLNGQSSCERKSAVYGDGHRPNRHVSDLDDPRGGSGRNSLCLRTVYGSGSRGRLSRARHEQRGSHAERHRDRSPARVCPYRSAEPCPMHRHASSKWHSALYGRRYTQRRFRK